MYSVVFILFTDYFLCIYDILVEPTPYTLTSNLVIGIVHFNLFFYQLGLNQLRVLIFFPAI